MMCFSATLLGTRSQDDNDEHMVCLSAGQLLTSHRKKRHQKFIALLLPFMACVGAGHFLQGNVRGFS
jgi:hypothetical protein